MVKTILKSLGLSAKLMFLAPPFLFNQAYAYVGGCSNLHVVINDAIFQKYETLLKNPRMIHGVYNGCLEIVRSTGDCTDYLFEQSNFSHGPEVELEFKERDTDFTEKIRIQQNYCFLEAGDITVTIENGYSMYFKYTKQTGSVINRSPGVVKILSIGIP